MTPPYFALWIGLTLVVVTPILIFVRYCMKEDRYLEELKETSKKRYTYNKYGYVNWFYLKELLQQYLPEESIEELTSQMASYELKEVEEVKEGEEK